MFLVVGIGFKFGAAPFHMWIPDVYQGAPTAVTLFIGSAPKDRRVRHGLPIARQAALGGHGQDHWREMLAVLAVASLAIGNIVAIAQTNLKRMLGVLDDLAHGLPAAGLAQRHAMRATRRRCSTRSPMRSPTTVAFGRSSCCSRVPASKPRDRRLQGPEPAQPWYALVVLLTMASLAGVPPLFGFFAKLLVLKAAHRRRHVVDGRSSRSSSRIVGAYYYLRVIKVMLLR